MVLQWGMISWSFRKSILVLEFTHALSCEDRFLLALYTICSSHILLKFPLVGLDQFLV